MWTPWRSLSPVLRTKTNKKGNQAMSKMDGLRAGIAEMRSVAQRLNQWADELEASFRTSEADAPEVPASEPGPAEKKTSKQIDPEPAAAPETGKTYTLPEVRAILAEKVAAGFGAQVKALIESYGVSSLKGVPADKYGELLEAVNGLGDAVAG